MSSAKGLVALQHSMMGDLPAVAILRSLPQHSNIVRLNLVDFNVVDSQLLQFSIELPRLEHFKASTHSLAQHEPQVSCLPKLYLDL